MSSLVPAALHSAEVGGALISICVSICVAFLILPVVKAEWLVLIGHFSFVHVATPHEMAQ